MAYWGHSGAFLGSSDPNANSTGSGGSSNTANVGKPAAAGQFQGIPQTIFPQYSMYGTGDWTRLPPPGQLLVQNGQPQGQGLPMGLFGGSLEEMRNRIRAGQFDMNAYVKMLMGRQ